MNLLIVLFSGFFVHATGPIRASDLCLSLLETAAAHGERLGGPRDGGNSLDLPIAELERRVREYGWRPRFQIVAMQLRGGHEDFVAARGRHLERTTHAMLSNLKSLDQIRDTPPEHAPLHHVFRGDARVADVLDTLIATPVTRPYADAAARGAAQHVEFLRSLREEITRPPTGVPRLREFSASLPLREREDGDVAPLTAEVLRDGIRRGVEEGGLYGRDLFVDLVLFHDGREWVLHVYAREQGSELLRHLVISN